MTSPSVQKRASLSDAGAIAEAASGAASIDVEWLGETSYAESLELQEAAVRDRLAGRTRDRILLLEHPRVVTLGRSTRPENLRVPAEDLRASGVEVFEVGRGGDVTYHAPGQLVGYPILDLAARHRRDVHDHLRRLEDALIRAVESFGIPACRVPGWTGVFIDREREAMSGDRVSGPERKIASIGVGLRRWVTFHGFALNVSLDLTGFDSIVPCGLDGVAMTSLAAELDRAGRGEEMSVETLDRQTRERVSTEMCLALGGSGPGSA